MAKIIVCRDQQVLQEVELGKARMTLGRHADNDIVIAHRAVSGQHAAFISAGADVFLEDLGSTNGTFVNGQRIARRLLEDGDQIVVAKFQIAFAGAAVPAMPAAPLTGSIEVTSGANAGKRLTLNKPLSTLGRPGVQVVAITRQGDSFYIRHVEGELVPQVNAMPLGARPQLLSNGDHIALVGADMVFNLTSS